MGQSVSDKEVTMSQLPERKHEIATLGDGEVFVKRTPEGSFRAVRGEIRLSQSDKEVASIPGGGVMISTYGYDKLNKFAGLTIVYPPQIPITVTRRGYPETAMVENPYIEYDDDGVMKVITVEALAIGLSPIGNWVITQERLRYDLHQYFVSDAWSKAKKYPACGKFVSRETYSKMEDRENRMFLRVMGDWGLALDVTHPDVMSTLTGQITRQKFAERIASSICRRNAMKRHPAIAKSEVKLHGGEAYVTVYGWQHDMTAAQLNKMVSLTTGGNLPPQIQLQSESKEVQYGDGEVSSVEVEIVGDDLDKQNGKDPKDPEEQGSLFSEEGALEDKEKMLIYLGSCEAKLGMDPFREILEPHVKGITKIFEISEDLDDKGIEIAYRVMREREK